MKKFILVLGLGSVLLLGACSKEAVKQATKEAEYLNTLDENELSGSEFSDMYLNIGVLSQMSNEYGQQMSEKNLGRLSATEKKEIREMSQEYKYLLKSIQFNPSKDYDYEMEDSAILWKQTFDLLMDNMIKYADTGDVTYLQLVNSYSKDIVSYTKDIKYVRDKYEIE